LPNQQQFDKLISFLSYGKEGLLSMHVSKESCKFIHLPMRYISADMFYILIPSLWTHNPMEHRNIRFIP